MGEGFLSFDIKTLIFIVIIIIVLISFVSILTLNIISYILFTIYCINDNINDYTSEDPTKITLEDKYKYRLLNYIINFNDSAKNSQYSLSTNYDNNSSDLYVHATIVYYNYIVKLLLFIAIIILAAFLFDLFIKAIGFVNDKYCKSDTKIPFLVSEIYKNDNYIYKIIIIIFIYIYLHSLIYTFGFNKYIYKDLYDLYEGGDGKYKAADMVVYLIIETIQKNKKTEETFSSFLSDFKDLSFDKLHFKNFLNKDFGLADNANKILTDLNSDGILNNNKFIIPTGTTQEKEANINKMLRSIYLTNTAADFYNEPGDAPVNKNQQAQDLLGDKIFIYLIYHYVISHNIEDPLIIHKINNIFLNLFNNIHTKYNNDYAKYSNSTSPDSTPASVASVSIDDILNKFSGKDIDIKKMYNEIKSSYTIKQLLPATIKKEDILDKLHDNADLILKYIYTYKSIETPTSLPSDKFLNYAVGRGKEFPDADKGTDNIYFLKKKIFKNINTFADSFSDYFQEDKTPLKVNTIVYKINLYLAVEMILTAVFILIVLLLLYSSNKYPDLEKYINIMITYAIIIINEVISAIFGII
uniref:Uncharacterized protein n=1 Tax=viral metagenome TaxID=1070528 RepID=A0A6C0IAX4_9ZZZZ